MPQGVKGDKNYLWKGDGVGYRGLHYWVERWKGTPKECSVCGEEKKRMAWANIDHKYRRVLDDYIRMCARCHHKYDIKQGLINIEKFKYSKRGKAKKNKINE